MTVREFLEHMDGAGLTVTDWDEMPEFLAQVGVTLDTNVNDFQWTAN